VTSDWRRAGKRSENYYAIHPSGEGKKELFHKTRAYSGLFWSPDTRFVAYVHEGFVALGVEFYHLMVRRLKDNSETWVADGVGCCINFQWVTNPELLKRAEAAAKAKRRRGPPKAGCDTGRRIYEQCRTNIASGNRNLRPRLRPRGGAASKDYGVGVLDPPVPPRKSLDGFRRRGAFHHAEGGFVDERHQNAIGDESWRVIWREVTRRCERDDDRHAPLQSRAGP
jgi:hypothetical protein